MRKEHFWEATGSNGKQQKANQNYFWAVDAQRALLGSNGKQRRANKNYFWALDAQQALLGSNRKQREATGGKPKLLLG